MTPAANRFLFLGCCVALIIGSFGKDPGSTLSPDGRFLLLPVGKVHIMGDEGQNVLTLGRGTIPDGSVQVQTRWSKDSKKVVTCTNTRTSSEINAGYLGTNWTRLVEPERDLKALISAAETQFGSTLVREDKRLIDWTDGDSLNVRQTFHLANGKVIDATYVLGFQPSEGRLVGKDYELTAVQ